MGPLEALASLKDIDGVYGSFVVDAMGTPTLRDLPTVISNRALAEAGPRLARLWGALPEDDVPDRLLLSFASHQLFVKKLSSGSLCVFAPPGVNRLALNVAANLVAGFLDSDADRRGPQPRPLSASDLASVAMPSRAQAMPRPTRSARPPVPPPLPPPAPPAQRRPPPLPRPPARVDGGDDGAARATTGVPTQPPAARAAAAAPKKTKTIVYRGRRYEI